MGNIFTNKKFSDYLGENRAILDIITDTESLPTPTPSPTSVTQTPTPTPTVTPTPSPVQLFNIGEGFDNTAQSVFVDSSDNIFVGGNFFGYDETLSIGGLVKLDTTGAIDLTFNAGIVSTLSMLAIINKIVEDETGDYIYVVGAWSTVPQRIVKIDKTTGLNVWTAIAVNSSIIDIAVDSVSGDVYVVGNFTTINGNTRQRIAHFNNAGVLQSTFSGTAFNTTASSIIINRNGNLVVIGNFITFGGVSAVRIIEIETTTYTNTGLWGTGASQQPRGLFQRQDDGDYVIVGNGGTVNGVTIGKVSKFTEAAVNIAYTTVLGGIVPVGIYLDESNNFIYISDIQGVGIRRYDYDTGNTDTTFETNIGSTTPVPNYSGTGTRFVIQLDSSNRIYWVGSFVFVNGVSFNRIVRLNQNGTNNTV